LSLKYRIFEYNLIVIKLFKNLFNKQIIIFESVTQNVNLEEDSNLEIRSQTKVMVQILEERQQNIKRIDKRDANI
jgi:hypothetical protein